MVERACTTCHDFSEFPRVNFDREDWETIVNTMVGGGAPLKKEEIPVVIDYLAMNFKGEATPGVVVPGPVQATINEWDVPTPNSLPQGIIHSPNSGLTWYTGQFSNVMGRFDPKTQQFKEYHLRPGTNPTSLVEWEIAAVKGLLYFTPQTGSFIGHFQPRNGPYPIWSGRRCTGTSLFWSPAPVARHRQQCRKFLNLVHRIRCAATHIFGRKQDRVLPSTDYGD